MPAADITSAMTSAAENPCDDTSPSITPTLPAAQAAEGVEVAAHRVGRQASRGDLGVALEHRGRRQELELEIVGQLELPLQPLLLRVALHQPGVLDRGADLVGDRAHQLPVVEGEAVAADAVGQVHDADAAEPRCRARHR